jgi:arylsulfatase A-like enzyme
MPQRLSRWRLSDCNLSGLALALLAVLTCCQTAGADGKPPNILVILADDLGRGDYSAFGTRDIRTPAIDRLGREGITLENFYANSCVCSPTRAALLSGCYPDRVGVPGVIRDIPANSWGYLSREAVLLPALLRPAGYHTAIIGKWHLGYDPPNTPLDRGFDFFHGFLGDMMDDYQTHLRNGKNFMRKNRGAVEPQGHATDLFTSWACDYLSERAKEDRPFFLYLAYNARTIRSATARVAGEMQQRDRRCLPSGRRWWPSSSTWTTGSARCWTRSSERALPKTRW